MRDNKIETKKNLKLKEFTLNFGPQHPASHGVLRMVLALNGELIDKADPHIGFLHRGTEKLIENRTLLKSIPYFDRLDYVSMMNQEHAFCISIEKMLNMEPQENLYNHIRTLFDELTRIMNHLLAISTHALDVGNMSPVFWAFEEREKIMEFYERVSGARMHAAFYRPNTLDLTGISNDLFRDILLFTKNTFKSITEIFSVLVTNKIWRTRLVNIGIIKYNEIIEYGLSGPIARSAGFKYDLRLSKYRSYASYKYLTFTSFLGNTGDSYDRFLIRIREMYESINIIIQITKILLKINISKFQKTSKFNSMEKLIEHFKYYSENILIKKGFSYASVEAPKGEMGVSLIGNNSNKPFRCKIRTPAFHHMQVIPKLSVGHLFADLVTILGSQDIVFGDVDR